MASSVVQLVNVSKQYRLGEVGAGTLRDDLQRLWARVRGREDPTREIGTFNSTDTYDSKYVWAVRDVNLEVEEGTILGLVGKNGAGKSTILKLLSRVTAPTTGELRLRGRIASLLEVGTGFHPELTGRENVFLNGAILGMTKSEIRRKLEEIVDFSGVRRYIDTPVKRYSSGMQVRLAFAVAAHLEAEIMVVDEVLAVGDAEFQARAIGRMKDVSTSGRTVLFVSHNLTAVQKLCNRAVLLEGGAVTLDGSVGDVLARYRGTTRDGQAVEVSGTGQAELVEYKIMTRERGDRMGDVELGGTLGLRLKIRANEALERLNVSVEIRTDLDEHIAHVSNMDDEFAIANLGEGEERWIEVAIRNFSLAPGDYNVSLWLGDHFHNFHYVQRCLRFNASQGDHFIRRMDTYGRTYRAVLQSSWRYPA